MLFMLLISQPYGTLCFTNGSSLLYISIISASIILKELLHSWTVSVREKTDKTRRYHTWRLSYHYLVPVQHGEKKARNTITERN
ncbi:thioredoxin domain-containing protein 3 X5 [Biomphalaria glabrata]